MKATIYRISNADTIRFGRAPSYVCEPVSSGLLSDGLTWQDEVAVELPEGYTIQESALAGLQLYDPQGKHDTIFDVNGHPSIALGEYVDPSGTPRLRTKRIG